MRTTLTIDDDLAGVLQKRASQGGQSFKSVVNDLLRAGLAASGEALTPRPRIQVKSRPLGMRPGYNPDKLNQLADELEVEDFLRRVAKDDSARR
jgi:hypothetical protein